MALAETAQSRKAVLPPGNQWVFSNRNDITNPHIYQHEYRDLGQLSENMSNITQMVHRDYIRGVWNFSSVLGSRDSFAIVFTHPGRTETVSKFLPPDFLQLNILEDPDRRTNFWPLPLEAINRLLEGTNLYAYNAHGAYNEIDLERQKGLFRKSTVRVGYFQSGVAYILANLHSIEDQLQFAVEYKITRLVVDFKETLQPLKAEKSRLLAAKVSKPKALFPH